MTSSSSALVGDTGLAQDSYWGYRKYARHTSHSSPLQVVPVCPESPSHKPVSTSFLLPHAGLVARSRKFQTRQLLGYQALFMLDCHQQHPDQIFIFLQQTKKQTRPTLQKLFRLPAINNQSKKVRRGLLREGK